MFPQISPIEILCSFEINDHFWPHMVSALVPGSSGPGSSPGQGHCVVFLGKTLSQCLSPPRSINGYRRKCWGNLTNCG